MKICKHFWSSYSCTCENFAFQNVWFLSKNVRLWCFFLPKNFVLSIYSWHNITCNYTVSTGNIKKIERFRPCDNSVRAHRPGVGVPRVLSETYGRERQGIWTWNIIGTLRIEIHFQQILNVRHEDEEHDM